MQASLHRLGTWHVPGWRWGGRRRDSSPPSPPSAPRSSEGRGEDSRRECFKAPALSATQTPAESTPATTVITIVTNNYYRNEASQQTHGVSEALLLPFDRCGN